MTVTEATTRTLDAPGATLTYDVWSGGSTDEVPLFLIGSPMGAAGFGTLAGHFPDRTLITCDPRGSERSTKDDPTTESTPEQHAGDLVMSGCGELARELIEAGLVDELYFWIHPRIQGPGGRPYEAATVPVRLIEARQFDSGVTLLRYLPL